MRVFEKISGLVIKFRWLTITLWLITLAIIYFISPDLSSIAQSNQESFLPKDSNFSKSVDLINQMFPDQSGGNLILVFYRDDQPLSTSDVEYINKVENYLNDRSQEFKISKTISPYTATNSEVKDSMISKDQQAAFIIAKLNGMAYSQETTKIIEEIENCVTTDGNPGSSLSPIPPSGLQVNITGDLAFSGDERKIIDQSMGLTTEITIILIAIVLIIVFRSPITPLIPLLTIGISFLISRGVVSLMAAKGFKVSTFTETFLIAILFGAGTDYCMLVISRFREEILKNKVIDKLALSKSLYVAMPKVGASILSSGGTVIVGFMFMIFAKFGLFSTTGPSVAIGVAITILAVLTLTPAIISILGENIFWPRTPSKKIDLDNNAQTQLPMWGKIATAVTTKPLKFVLISLLALLPFLISTVWITRSYNQIADLPFSANSVKGFNAIEKHFEQGNMIPIRVVIETNKDMWSSDLLQALDAVADDITKIDGVTSVRTATRPLGEKISEVSLPNQLATLSGGLSNATTGINSVIDTLDKMQNSMKPITAGISTGSDQLGQLASATQQLEDSVAKISSGLSSLSNGQSSAIGGIKQSLAGLKAINTSLEQSRQGIISSQKAMQSLHDGLVSVSTKYALSQPSVSADLAPLIGYCGGIIDSISVINTGLLQIESGVNNIINGLDNSSTGLTAINQGITDANNGLSKVQPALAQMKDGQIKASKDLAAASSGLNAISSGFEPSEQGLTQIESGLSSASNTTKDYSSNALNNIFYLPDEVLNQHPELKNAMSMYISNSNNSALLDVYLSLSPYSNAALDKVEDVSNITKHAIRNTPLSNAGVYTGGTISAFSEVRSLTTSDLIKVMMFVLLGILIVLVLLLRSLIAPVYLLLTILISFGATMGISFLSFHFILGEDGLIWSTPFFSFCLLVALGVDYNIFLMSRVKEEYVLGKMKEAVASALTNTGGVITSCGIIMAGTFAALLFSPIHTLSQIGFSAVIGMLLDTFVIRCLLVPSIAVKLGDFNWWPRKVY